MISFIFVNLLFFAAIVIFAYYLTPPRFQWIVLLASSMLFYLLLDLRAFVYIIVTICSVFICGKLVYISHVRQDAFFSEKNEEWRAANRSKYTNRFNTRRKMILIIGLLLNFGILATLKYSNFIIELLNQALGAFRISLPGAQWLLPVGVSFYTFQAIGYLIDVYRKKYPAERNIARFALFVSFFPQIVQGPIGRFDHMAPQLFASHRFDYHQLTLGLQLIGWGFAKKLLIADVLSPVIKEILHDQYAAGTVVAVGIIMSMLQVYTDFSGGIDVSRGIAQCLGIELTENFRQPYFAISISDYWRRWHMTLGAWMKDYLLYSITFSKGFSKFQRFSRKKLGNPGKTIPTCLAMFFVFFVVGIWHGASMKYVFFGLYNGILIATGIFMQPFIDKLCAKIPGLFPESKLKRALSTTKTLILVFIGKTVSASDNFAHGCSLLMKMTSDLFHSYSMLSIINSLVNYGLSTRKILLLILPILALFVISLLKENGVSIRNAIDSKPIALRWSIYYFVMFYIVLFSETSNIGGFVYARF